MDLAPWLAQEWELEWEDMEVDWMEWINLEVEVESMVMVIGMVAVK